MSKSKYKIGDIVGVCSDGMYEFVITQIQPKPLMYAGKCIKVGGGTAIKIDDEYAIQPRQIVLKLNLSDETAEEWQAGEEKRKSKE